MRNFRLQPIFSAFLLLIVSLQLIAQDKGNSLTTNENAKKNFSKGRALYEANRFDEAIKYLDKAIEADNLFVHPYMLKAIMQQKSEQPDKARETYKKILSLRSDVYEPLMNLAAMEYGLNNFKEAKEYYIQISQHKATSDNHRTLANDRIRKCTQLQKLVDNPIKMDVENLGENINTKEDEYYPTFTVDGKTLYFTRKKTKKIIDQGTSSRIRVVDNFNEDILVSYFEDGKWTLAKDCPAPLNTDNNEGAMCISSDGSFMIFTRCTGLNCDLFISYKSADGSWTNPENLGPPINTRHYETNPTLSADNKTLFYAANRPEGLGGTDIYMSKMDKDGNWGEPVNLGPTINTPKNEWAPFIHPDGQTLYFCSEGHYGFGGKDVFFSRLNSSGRWDTAQNIGYPINNNQDQLCFIVDRTGKRAYISSEMSPSMGALDIYSVAIPEFAKPKPVTYLKGRTIHQETKKPISAIVEVYDIVTKITIRKVTTKEDGNFLIALNAFHEYGINASKKGFLFFSEHIDLTNYKDNTPYEYDVPLTPIAKGNKISLRNIFFEVNSFDLKEGSFVELNKVVELLKDNQTMKLEISGHTDNTGNPKSNQELSLKRAKSVTDYLVSKGGISKDRLLYKGYGETKPLKENNSEDNKALNRRTEITVL